MITIVLTSATIEYNRTSLTNSIFYFFNYSVYFRIYMLLKIKTKNKHEIIQCGHLLKILKIYIQKMYMWIESNGGDCDHRCVKCFVHLMYRCTDFEIYKFCISSPISRALNRLFEQKATLNFNVFLASL